MLNTQFVTQKVRNYLPMFCDLKCKDGLKILYVPFVWMINGLLCQEFKRVALHTSKLISAFVLIISVYQKKPSFPHQTHQKYKKNHSNYYWYA